MSIIITICPCTNNFIEAIHAAFVSNFVPDKSFFNSPGFKMYFESEYCMTLVLLFVIACYICDFGVSSSLNATFWCQLR